MLDDIQASRPPVPGAAQSQKTKLRVIQRFLHRLSLVHSRVEILFKFKSIDYTYHHTFGGKAEARVSGMDQAIVMDSTRYGLCPFSRGPLPSCSRLHPVLGERVELSLSSEAVETGLCGEISFVPMATLGPCMAQYPNWPTRLSRIRVFVYGPCKMPLMRAAGEEPMSFLRKLAASLSWTELGLSGVHYTELQPNEDYPYADIEFLVETDVHPEREPEGSTVIRQEPKPECNHAIEQSITLFFLLQHNDPFQSQLSDFITSEEVLERHLDRLLWLNREKVQASLQSVLQNTLMSYKKRQMAKRKMQSALSVMLNSMTSVVSSSSSARFRTACLDYMRVQDTHELSASLRQSFQRITDSRFVPSCGCRAGKIEEGVNFHQNGSGTREDLVLKRAHQRGQTSCGSKKQCSEKTNVTPSSYCPSTSRMTIFLMQPSQSQHSHLGNTTPSSSSSGTSEFENEQVEKEWLQEIENIPEWD
ncbi:type 2 DNA topoisomerase 6 subunit B-like [Chanos chanos]|uniref:Type 2 DNA topoisomerase 6 subunit B-like n=1 Tax=Chanos chanos TaxID=29144 RepID=A0A6J2UMQ4_CHACN|nr:type 2 DNA topoisomerase 6 subunit B-like [Chanos chanos]